MLYHGSKAGAFDLKTVVMESITSMTRAGEVTYSSLWHNFVCVCCTLSFIKVQTSSSHTSLRVFWTGSKNRSCKIIRLLCLHARYFGYAHALLLRRAPPLFLQSGLCACVALITKTDSTAAEGTFLRRRQFASTSYRAERSERSGEMSTNYQGKLDSVFDG